MSDMSVFPDDNRSRNNEDAPVAHTASSGGFYMSQMIIPCLFGCFMFASMGGGMIYFARDAGQWGLLLVLAGIVLFALAGCAIYWPIKCLNDATATTDGNQETSPGADITKSLPLEPVLSDAAQKQLKKIENRDVTALGMMLTGCVIPFVLLSNTPSYIDTQSMWLIVVIGLLCSAAGALLSNRYRKQAAAIRSSSEVTDS